jgi:hypothetical protein
LGGRSRLTFLCLLVACLLVACGEADDGSETEDGPLPRAVAIVAQRGGGAPVSVYFAVEPNPRGKVDVRLTNRITLPGPRGAFTLSASQDEPAHWALVEEVRSARVALPLPPTSAWTLQRFQPRQAWFSTEDAPAQLCDLLRGDCSPAPTPPPALSLRRAGPGGGFRLGLEAGTLRFWPPYLPPGADGELILDDVTALLAVRWLQALPAAPVLEYLDRSFRGAGRLEATAGVVTLDGNLEEWRDADPNVVDAPWQAAVREHWTGPADASYSIGAMATPTRLCFAGRYRDDDLRPGDVLTLHLAAERWTVPLHPGAQAEGLVLAPEPFGHRFEVCRAHAAVVGTVPFAALLQDRDGEDEADLLSTSPLYDGQPAGTLSLPP